MTTDRPGGAGAARNVPKPRRLLEVVCPDKGCRLLVVERRDDGRVAWRPLSLRRMDDGRRMDVSDVVVTDGPAPGRMAVRCRCLLADVPLDPARLDAAIAQGTGRRRVSRLRDVRVSGDPALD